MSLATQIAVGAIALMHVGFLVLEMFLWDKPTGRRVFGHSQEAAAKTKVLAANQGLYNGFLAAGLLWSLLAESRSVSIALFFLSCVFVAGVYGAWSASRTILWVQARPAAVALLLLHLT